MTNRRNFLKQSGALILGGLAFPGMPPQYPPAGVQLFTFFNIIDQDVQGTLKKIADLGYKEIESAFSRKGGFYGLKASEFNSMLKDLGLSWKSHHVGGAPYKPRPGAPTPKDAKGNPITIPPMKNLRENYQEIVEEMARAGVPYLVCAGTPINNTEEIKASLTTLQKTAEAAKKAGIHFAYHNHEAEFKEVEGIKPYDVFLGETDPSSMKFELDLGWATKAGVNAVELFRQHPGRFPLWHVKDITTESKIVPVGEGIVPFRDIFSNAGKAGLDHYFVEHDMPADPFASIETSMKAIRTLIQA